ncbi:bifunctional DNA-formamidopyrimidine glycosylase/DNA-(apurinic or apyrimidinic site) lyase [Corynebacterium sp. CCM 9185]|uniref:Bifunctional DNA-formamidopyrimidine glycosylase/DNA-(Apurinic or apyrimidinic site) lyase n=1 Tax=Corynebacterium marambiense TaxID=2765364 RepID=A0ABS0VVI6_9CORY|nr:bifunctional DNA-formamidopyrimidine glycosylase/DNA-(apurinic or apyrimidinic site) lyase [Corynebacterium marambiense]MBI9000788.1 bifunctional DNA-formamidopyrimidine glycosylase/DNA-(apurinic or apyrimidinic site) lyase [Corynebacterium marambiense]MCK7662946.1 bifunctional DNA-formamidopyrimidine glycosylase/DNA-(apurinic or apyrimidinic site) lyase [Corynebacterium marambiense]MCX7542555.1 bifunctional DNA-formamidopyrimidine glycosylase/DNA-(apurinic or apyrimidinic site) lyase [Coryne
MPELPEVETVRSGLANLITGARIDRAEVLHPRAARNNAGGQGEVSAALKDRLVSSVERRGKFLWLVLAPGDDALLVHLGMSGQMLIKDPGAGERDPNLRHRRAFAVLDDGREVWFVDQRTFGYWSTGPLVDGRSTAGPDTRRVPLRVAHIAPDLLEPDLDLGTVARTLKTRDTEIKRLLLAQEIVSGIGNIYADEMLWRARVHPRQRASRMSVTRITHLLGAGIDVMRDALAQGGTSFDALYVNVNGDSGYFDRSLNVYGRTGRDCVRCGFPVTREQFMNRSSHFCGNCQRRY